MKRLKLPILLFFLTVTSFTSAQVSQNKNIDTLSTQIFDCDSDSIELVLPLGWNKIENFEFMEGFIKTYSYLDGSTVSILCGSNAILDISDTTLNSRKISIKGRELIYEQVPIERVSLFDDAFDFMEKK
jgi:hypothetical protein